MDRILNLKALNLRTLIVFLICLMVIAPLAGCKERPSEVKIYKTEVEDQQAQETAGGEGEAVNTVEGKAVETKTEEKAAAKEMPSENSDILEQSIIYKSSAPKEVAGGAQRFTVERKQVVGQSVFSGIACDYVEAKSDDINKVSKLSFTLSNPTDKKLSLDKLAYEGAEEIISVRVWINSEKIELAKYCNAEFIEPNSSLICADVRAESLKKGVSPWNAELKNKIRADSLAFGSEAVFKCR